MLKAMPVSWLSGTIYVQYSTGNTATKSHQTFIYIAYFVDCISKLGFFNVVQQDYRIFRNFWHLRYSAKQCPRIICKGKLQWSSRDIKWDFQNKPSADNVIRNPKSWPKELADHWQVCWRWKWLAQCQNGVVASSGRIQTSKRVVMLSHQTAIVSILFEKIIWN